MTSGESIAQLPMKLFTIAFVTILGGMLIANQDLSGVAQCRFTDKVEAEVIKSARQDGHPNAIWQCETDSRGNIISRRLVLN